MDFDLLAETVLSDVRTKKIPILYVIELLIILEDMNLLKEDIYE